MIANVFLKNFKCFREEYFEMGPLTLLAGLNNSGKSTVFQAIRMVSRWASGVDPLLPGHGSFKEIINKEASKDHPIQIALTTNCGINANMEVSLLAAQEPKINGCTDASYLPRVSYLSADRWGPRVSLPLYTGTGDLSHVGESGEYVIDFLSRHERDIIPPLLRHPDAEGETLEYNVRAWLNEISPNILFKHASDEQRDSSYATLDGFRPTNSGFGLSYSLPIIVLLLGLASRCDSASIEGSCPVVLIENPEAHLHPRGQSRMGHLLALAAKAGIQTFVETHSDHVLNGIRIAVHRGTVAPSDVKMFFFSKANGKTEIKRPQIDKDGRIDIWPEGFFDEWDKALDQLLLPSGGK